MRKSVGSENHPCIICVALIKIVYLFKPNNKQPRAKGLEFFIFLLRLKLFITQISGLKTICLGQGTKAALHSKSKSGVD